MELDHRLCFQAGSCMLARRCHVQKHAASPHEGSIWADPTVHRPSCSTPPLLKHCQTGQKSINLSILAMFLSIFFAKIDRIQEKCQFCQKQLLKTAIFLPTHGDSLTKLPKKHFLVKFGNIQLSRQRISSLAYSRPNLFAVGMIHGMMTNAIISATK